MLLKMPGVFLAGEMIDWEAPTGGYLLQGCFSTGTRAGRAAAGYACGERPIPSEVEGSRNLVERIPRLAHPVLPALAQRFDVVVHIHLFDALKASLDRLCGIRVPAFNTAHQPRQESGRDRASVDFRSARFSVSCGSSGREE